MGKKKKPFIDKKHAVKFQLVHRGQRDPLQADADAPERVLHPLDEPPKKSRRDELKQLGVYYDDEYDYMQHLKARGEGTLVMAEENAPVINKVTFKDFGGGISLPSEVLASEYEEIEGVLEKGVLPRGPQPDWDPDIVEALDDGLDLDDPDNIIEDNFILLADAEAPDTMHRGDDEYQFSGSEVDSDGFDFDSGSDESFSHEETKSRFTNYSMTSSVIRRTEGLRLLDDRFENIMEDYDDDDIGELDEDDVGGVLTPAHPLVDQMIEEVNKEQQKITYTEIDDKEPREKAAEVENLVEDLNESDGDEKEDIDIMEKSEKEKWDCESILSTYSNIYNHPKVISEPPKVKPIKLTKKLAIPADVLKKKAQKTETQDSVLEDEKKLVTTRPKNEAKEEKKLRKNAVKEERRERRAEKKANKLAFKFEQKTQEKILAKQPVLSSVKM